MKNMELMASSLLTTLVFAANSATKKCYNYVDCIMYEEKVTSEAMRSIPCKYSRM